jgi:hypothetical protein
MTRIAARWCWLGAGLALALWVVLAFVVALPTGWVHGFLVAGVLAMVHGIVRAEQEGGHEQGGQGRS